MDLNFAQDAEETDIYLIPAHLLQGISTNALEEMENAYVGIMKRMESLTLLARTANIQNMNKHSNYEIHKYKQSRIMEMKKLKKKALLLCAMCVASLYGYAQSTVYLISSHDQTASSMTVKVNGGADGMIKMESPYHKSTLGGYLKWYQKMIRKCTFKEEGQVVLSYDVEMGTGKQIHQEVTLNLKDGETYYVKVWGKKWAMKEIIKKDYDKLTKKMSEYHICPDWSSADDE